MVNTYSKPKKLSASREIAYIAITCALLIGGQFIFSFIVGVEIVTLILVCFSFVFGIRRGIITAICFSILRCCIYGFYPTAVILYLIYYPLLAAVGGILGKCKNFDGIAFAIAINLIALIFCALALGMFFTDFIKVAKAYRITLKILLLVISILSFALAAIYDIVMLSKSPSKQKVAKILVVACAGGVMTCIFTLLDDVITPLFFGYTRLAALAYFYSSFTAMLPQIVCAIVTLATLFEPITAVMQKFFYKN